MCVKVYRDTAVLRSTMRNGMSPGSAHDPRSPVELSDSGLGLLLIGELASACMASRPRSARRSLRFLTSGLGLLRLNSWSRGG
jgi:hypothetical protein